ncbi:MAG: hypothetical protein HY807_08790 [Nitrospirae bacterium]|nr:hypothetical protein [Nitrospirota bacterium]
MFDKITDLLYTSSLLSWPISLLGILFLLSPLIIGRWILNKYSYKYKSMTTGFILGLIALPLSLWLSLHYSLDGARAALGGVGSIILLFHQLPILLLSFNSEGLDKLYLLFGSIVWVIVYGLIGLMFDLKRIKDSS